MENLKECSDKRLINLRNKYRSKVSHLNNTQMSLKILLNSGYGALANKFFRWFDLRLASAITLSGQLAIRWIEKYLMEHKLQKKYGWDIIYSDTDSVAGDTIIYVNGKKQKIEDYYNSLTDCEMIIDDDFNENYVKEIKNGDKSLSVSKDFNIEDKNISYIMKHKVIKEIFEIEVDDKKVVITEDHSIMVKRRNKLISVKPTEIKENDELIKIF